MMRFLQALVVFGWDQFERVEQNRKCDALYRTTTHESTYENSSEGNNGSDPHCEQEL